jgi:uncharacterized protein YaaQ
MKLIITIVRDTDSEKITNALTGQEFRVTNIASTGGLWRRGMTTLLIGVDDKQVENALQIIRDTLPQPGEPASKLATIFIVPVEKFVQF